MILINPDYYCKSTGCDEYHTSTNGSISSPNYPGAYPSNSDCTYIIDIPGASAITITFQDRFLLEANFDKLYYGTGLVADTSLAVGTLSSYILPPPLTLYSSTVWLRFISDDNVVYEGFIFVWDVLGDIVTFPPSTIATTIPSGKNCNLYR